MVGRLAQALKSRNYQGSASRIATKAGKKVLFIDSADIIAVEAEGNYVLLRHKSSAYLLRESISTMAAKLSLFGFVRIHRSSLVNTAFVEKIHRLSTGEYVLRVRGGKKYIVTRNYKKIYIFLPSRGSAPTVLSRWNAAV
jgi:two-component system, LytTR family, response regulator